MTQPPTPGIRLTADQFAIRRLDGEIVLFSTLSGQTHLLDPSLVAIFDLLLLDETPQMKETVVADIARHIGSFQGDLENFVDQALGELQDIGLIEIVEPS